MASNAWNTIPEELFKKATSIDNASFDERLSFYSKSLLDTSYGNWDTTDKKPEDEDAYINNLIDKPHLVYTFEQLDCMLYVESVLALALIEAKEYQSKESFQEAFETNLKNIAYKKGEPTFINRNHFVSGDWLPANAGLLSDQTSQISQASQSQKTTITSQVAQAEITRFDWLFKCHVKKQCSSATLESTKLKLNEKLAKNPEIFPEKQPAKINYLPISTILEDVSSFNQSMPNFALVNFVRPNWDLTKLGGTHMNVSHQGFVYKNEEGNMRLRHATSQESKKVVDTCLIEYLKKFENSPTLLGINISTIHEHKPWIKQKSSPRLTMQ